MRKRAKRIREGCHARSVAWTNRVNFPGIYNVSNGSMIQFAVGFVITPRRRGGRSKPKTRWIQKWAAGPHKSKTTQRSKRQVRKSELTNDEASSDGNTHKSKHKLRGGGAGKTTRAKARHKKNA